LDRRKGWRTAERLLKQGKVEAALEQLRKISDDPAGGVVTLNRLADLLAQMGRSSEAIGYYTKIAKQFEHGGFLPKAIAIHKKILRLDPDCLDSAIRLGHFYSRENLQGEARKYFLHAANRYVELHEFSKAREIFERVVGSDPDDLPQRVRLAETRVAEGDPERAAEDLLAVGEALLARSANGEAEPIFERARDLAPDSDAALVGVALCREAAGRKGEALDLLESRLAKPGAAPSVRGEVARFYEAAGRGDEAMGLLAEVPVPDVPAETWARLFSDAVARDDADGLWERFDPLLQPAAEDRPAEVVALLIRIGEIEPDGHVPALLRLARLSEVSGELRGAVQALDALARAYRARSMDDEANRVLERMRKVAPPDEEPRPAPGPAPTRRRDAAVPPPPERKTAVGAVPLEAEAPAVPLNRSDEEFVTGRVTQAEVLEKYDLLPQALEQLDEVVARFPGHVAAQERRVEVIRELDDRASLPGALAQLALARRAAGEKAGAQSAANEAASLPELEPASRRLLERLGLANQPASAASRATAPPSPPERETAPPVAVEGGSEVVIDLDDEGPEAGTVEPTSHAEPGPPGGEPSVVASESSPAPPEVAVDPGPGPEPSDDGPEDEDLQAIKVALGDEFLVSEDESIVPEESPDQSMDEVIRTFKERLGEEVDEDDHRTHYELGIGLKEMGLVDEAIEELSKVVGVGELHCEVCAMLALCHRDRGETDEAVAWYTRGLGDGDAEPDIARGLRYDLAETLLEKGDAEGALEQFRDVQALDPGFRDVQARVGELEDRLRS